MRRALRSVLFLAAALAPLATPARAEKAACACSDLEALQQEIENARTLRDRHAAKAAEIADAMARGAGRDRLASDYAAWEKGAAGAGIVPTAGDGSVPAISYVPAGVAEVGVSIHYEDYQSWTTAADGREVMRVDPAKAKALEERLRKQGKDLCEFSDLDAVRRGAAATSPCREVEQLVLRHEEHHRDTCRKMGFFAFFERTPDQLAADEVAAYDAQLAALRKLLGKALNGAAVQYEDTSHVTYSGSMFNFKYVFTTEPTRAEVPSSEDGSWTADLKGLHRTRAEFINIAGMSCSMTPFSRDVEMKISTDGKTANVTFVKFGPTGKIALKCPKGGGGGGTATPDRAGETVSLPLKLTSTRSDDVAKSPLAAMAAGVAKVTGSTETKLQIICPAEKK